MSHAGANALAATKCQGTPRAISLLAALILLRFSSAFVVVAVAAALGEADCAELTVLSFQSDARGTVRPCAGSAQATQPCEAAVRQSWRMRCQHRYRATLTNRRSPTGPRRIEGLATRGFRLNSRVGRYFANEAISSDKSVDGRWRC
jgi:hypothetical protein